MMEVYRLPMALLRYILVDIVIIIAAVIWGSLATILSWLPYAPDFCGRMFNWTCRAAGGVSVITKGAENIPPGTTNIYMSNHVSHYDGVCIYFSLPWGTRLMAKKELGRVPFFGWALIAMGNIMVDRKNLENAIQSLDKNVEKVRRGTGVLVFAEGTRSSDGRLQPFKKGGFILAIKAGVDIVPISVWGSGAILPKGSLRVKSGTVTVVIGRPIPTKGYTIDNKEELMGKVRAAMLEGLAAAGAPPSVTNNP